jgi:stage II sporulation protein AA (anti-sigma F factor antagonist)
MPHTAFPSETDHADSILPAFACTCRHSGLGTIWVHVTGGLELATAPALEQTLTDAQPRAVLVVLDLRELTSIDRAGVEVIVGASLRARETGRRLILVRVPPHVDRMLAVTGTSDAVLIGDCAGG